MKKIYSAPNTIIVKVELTRMVANSPLSFTGESGQGELQNVEGVEGVVLSRHGSSLWDDED